MEMMERASVEIEVEASQPTLVKKTTVATFWSAQYALVILQQIFFAMVTRVLAMDLLRLVQALAPWT